MTTTDELHALRADQAAAHKLLDAAGIGERGAKLEIRIARLIRMCNAAPELLNLLELCAEQLAHCLGNELDLVVRARAAIAKAQGGAE